MEKNEIAILSFTFAIVLVALGVFLILFYFLFKKKQQAHRMKIIALNEELLKTEIEIQEQTLRNVGEEIHDNIGQILSLAKLNLGTINVQDDENRLKLKDTRELVSKAIIDLRDLAKSMHGEKIAEIGIKNAVDHELKIIQNTGKFETHLSISGDQFPLKPQLQMVLFRIIQEALHNEIKHSKAKNIHIGFNYGPKTFSLTLKDDGVGFDVEKLDGTQTGIGLRSMKNRASLIGGEFFIHSYENKGTTIEIRIPKEKSV